MWANPTGTASTRSGPNLHLFLEQVKVDGSVCPILPEEFPILDGNGFVTGQANFNSFAEIG
jgi:hypothetical protein